MNEKLEKLEKAMEGKTSYKELIIENQGKEIERLNNIIDRTVDGMQQLIDDVNTKTIISLNNFIPKLEEIQDKLAGGDDNE